MGLGEGTAPMEAPSSSSPLMPPPAPLPMHPPPYLTPGYPMHPPLPHHPPHPMPPFCWRSTQCPGRHEAGEFSEGQTTVFMYAPMGPGLVSPTPFPGIRVEAPVRRPLPGQVIVGYETSRAEAGCFTCGTLTPVGWCFTLAWVAVCWPLALTTCLVPAFHEIIQRPVYGSPQFAQPSVKG